MTLTLAHAHCMHRVLWDAYAHAHHPLYRGDAHAHAHWVEYHHLPNMILNCFMSKKSEKGVSFGAIETKETIGRHSSSIGKLTSLVNKLDMRLDRQESQYRPAVYQNRGRGHPQRQSNYEYRNTSYSQDRNQSYGVEEIFSTITEVIGPTIGIEVDQGIMGMEIAIREAIMPKIIEGIIVDRTMAIKDTEIGTEV